jgi:hypothetical protein
MGGRPNRAALLNAAKYVIFSIGAVFAFSDYTKTWQRIAIVVVWCAIMGATAAVYLRRRGQRA